MDGRDFLAISDRYKSSIVEAERRTSIGRAYYALFNFLIRTLARHGVVFHRATQDHAQLTKYLDWSNHSKAQHVGQILRDLRNVRNDSDYEMSKEVGQKSSEFTNSKAHLAIKLLESIPADQLAVIAQRINART
jgi:uncharacterized protein (UPF0332 family)